MKSTRGSIFLTLFAGLVIAANWWGVGIRQDIAGSDWEFSNEHWQRFRPGRIIEVQRRYQDRHSRFKTRLGALHTQEGSRRRAKLLVRVV